MSELNLESKVTIRNTCEWDVYFSRIESAGDVRIPRKGQTRISRGEVQAQVYAGNVMFTGTDGKGSHARIVIEDHPTRVMVEFESEDGKEQQELLTSEKVAELLALKTLATFKKNVEKAVVTQAEKAAFIAEARKQKLNENDKIKFIEEFTGFKFNEE